MSAALAEVRLMIGAKESRLMLSVGGEYLEDELWKFDAKLSRSEAAAAARVAFGDLYDFMNFVTNGE